MTRLPKWPGAALVAAAGALLLAALSGAPYAPAGDEPPAVLRLSWRVRGAAVQSCRPPTEEEVAGLPAHMRPTRVCDRRVPTYVLRLRVDGRPLEEGLVEAAGARSDRPLYVFREVELEPGRHRIDVTFTQLAAGEEADDRREDGGPGGAPSGEPPPAGESPPPAPAHWELRAEVALGPGEVALVTIGADGRRLVVRRSGDR